MIAIKKGENPASSGSHASSRQGETLQGTRGGTAENSITGKLVGDKMLARRCCKMEVSCNFKVRFRARARIPLGHFCGEGFIGL